MKKVYRVFATAVSVIFPCLGILIPRSLQSVVPYLIFGALFILINIVPSL